MPRGDDLQREDALFEQLYDALGEEGVETIENQRARLLEQGVDIEQVLAKGMKLFELYRKRQRLARAREKAERIQEAVRGISRGTAKSFDAVREEIARALSADEIGSSLYQAVHRKLASVEPEDLQSLSDDAAIALFIEQFAGEDEHDNEE